MCKCILKTSTKIFKYLSHQYTFDIYKYRVKQPELWWRDPGKWKKILARGEAETKPLQFHSLVFPARNCEWALVNYCKCGRTQHFWANHLGENGIVKVSRNCPNLTPFTVATKAFGTCVHIYSQTHTEHSSSTSPDGHRRGPSLAT